MKQKPEFRIYIKMYLYVKQCTLILFGVLILCFDVNGEILRNEHDFVVAAKQADKAVIARAVENSEFLSSRLEIASNELVSRADEALTGGLQAGPTDVSDVCLNHTEMLLAAIVQRQTWAFRCKLLED